MSNQSSHRQIMRSEILSTTIHLWICSENISIIHKIGLTVDSNLKKKTSQLLSLPSINNNVITSLLQMWQETVCIYIYPRRTMCQGFANTKSQKIETNQAIMDQMIACLLVTITKGWYYDRRNTYKLYNTPTLTQLYGNT